VRLDASSSARSPAAERAEARAFLLTAVRFVCLGLIWYGAIYAASEGLVYRHGRGNRFFTIRTAPLERYDFVILGASHAAVLDYQDINERLEAVTGSRILNVSIVGAGPVVNRLVLEYFLARHRASAFVYVVDSFAFYSAEWNERRLEDVRLFQRAPFDVSLARLLLASPARPRVAVDYISGFSKINNPNRFRPEGEGEANRFERTYRPIPQLDRQRIDYLYPREIDPQALRLRNRYLLELEALIERARSAAGRTVIVRPPVPARFRAMIPGEDAFDAELEKLAAAAGAELRDFSRVANEDGFFYDTDHLNRRGVLFWIENYLASTLKP
jgi:hypothetical protein